MSELIYEIDGNMGKILEVYEDRCVISIKPRVDGALIGRLITEDKEYYYSDITSVQFNILGDDKGILQFEYTGPHSANKTNYEKGFIFAATGTDQNKQLKEQMPLIQEYILDRVKAYKDGRE